MNRRQLYLRAIVDLYLAQPDTPTTAKRSDWGIAATLYQRRLPLEVVAHAIRLVTVRRIGCRDVIGRRDPIGPGDWPAPFSSWVARETTMKSRGRVVNS